MGEFDTVRTLVHHTGGVQTTGDRGFFRRDGEQPSARPSAILPPPASYPRAMEAWILEAISFVGIWSNVFNLVV